MRNYCFPMQYGPEPDERDVYPDPPRELQEGASVTVHLSAYRTERRFGGREEGGWYYTAGECLASVPLRAVYERRKTGEWADRDGGTLALFVSHDELSWLEDHLKRTLGWTEEAEEKGWLELRLEQAPGADFPKTRPHYE